MNNQIWLGIGIFACCGEPHLFTASVGDREAFDAVLPMTFHELEATLGPCRQHMIVEMHAGQLADLQRLYALATSIEDAIAERSDDAADVVKDQLRKH